MGYYDTAQVCTNGHLITSSYKHYPEDRQAFCDKCGNETIIACQCCNTPIKGEYIEEGLCISTFTHVSSYCHNCGKPYPWTKEAIEAAQELLEIEDVLSKEEVEYLSKNLSSIISDTPKSTVTATKLKLAIGKLSSNIGSALYDVAIDIASESAKKILLGY